MLGLGTDRNNRTKEFKKGMGDGSEKRRERRKDQGAQIRKKRADRMQKRRHGLSTATDKQHTDEKAAELKIQEALAKWDARVFIEATSTRDELFCAQFDLLYHILTYNRGRACVPFLAPSHTAFPLYLDSPHFLLTDPRVIARLVKMASVDVTPENQEIVARVMHCLCNITGNQKEEDGERWTDIVLKVGGGSVLINHLARTKHPEILSFTLQTLGNMVGESRMARDSLMAAGLVQGLLHTYESIKGASVDYLWSVLVDLAFASSRFFFLQPAPDNALVAQLFAVSIRVFLGLRPQHITNRDREDVVISYIQLIRYAFRMNSELVYQIISKEPTLTRRIVEWTNVALPSLKSVEILREVVFFLENALHASDECIAFFIDAHPGLIGFLASCVEHPNKYIATSALISLVSSCTIPLAARVFLSSPQHLQLIKRRIHQHGVWDIREQFYQLCMTLCRTASKNVQLTQTSHAYLFSYDESSQDVPIWKYLLPGLKEADVNAIVNVLFVIRFALLCPNQSQPNHARLIQTLCNHDAATALDDLTINGCSESIRNEASFLVDRYFSRGELEQMDQEDDDVIEQTNQSGENKVLYSF